MSIKQYLKRGVQYIIHGQPIQKVYTQVTYLAPTELLKGRTALITGGTSGIDYEIAKAFINAGAECIITGRTEEKVQKVCNKISEETNTRDNAHGLAWDVKNVKKNEEKLQKAINLSINKKIDILVNNAGLVGGEIKDCTEEEYDSILDTNLKGSFFMAQLVARYMKENGIRGNILNIGSSSSLRPATSAYTVTKWGIRGLTKGLAKILSPYGITVNAIAPGPTATPMMTKGKNQNMALERLPLGRYIMPEEIANMAVILVSDMGRSIMGDIIYMTGGAGNLTYDDVPYTF